MIRFRIYYALTAAALIVLGLCSRKFSSQLPSLVADNSGDMLWAAMVYFGFRFLFVSKTLQWSFIACLLFSFLTEFSQLYQAEWATAIRGTTLGALVLGHGFLTIDLIRYSLGAVIAFAADTYFLKQDWERSITGYKKVH